MTPFRKCIAAAAIAALLAPACYAQSSARGGAVLGGGASSSATAPGGASAGGSSTGQARPGILSNAPESVTAPGQPGSVINPGTPGTLATPANPSGINAPGTLGGVNTPDTGVAVTPGAFPRGPTGGNAVSGGATGIQGSGTLSPDPSRAAISGIGAAPGTGVGARGVVPVVPEAAPASGGTVAGDVAGNTRSVPDVSPGNALPGVAGNTRTTPDVSPTPRDSAR